MALLLNQCRNYFFLARLILPRLRLLLASRQIHRAGRHLRRRDGDLLKRVVEEYWTMTNDERRSSEGGGGGREAQAKKYRCDATTTTVALESTAGRKGIVSPSALSPRWTRRTTWGRRERVRRGDRGVSLVAEHKTISHDRAPRIQTAGERDSEWQEVEEATEMMEEKVENSERWIREETKRISNIIK